MMIFLNFSFSPRLQLLLRRCETSYIAKKIWIVCPVAVFFCPVAVFFAQWLIFLPSDRFFAQWPFFLPSGRFFFGSGPQVPYFAQWPFFLAQVPFFAQVPFNSSCSLRKVCGGIKSFHKSAQPLKDIIQSFNNLPGSQYIWHSLNNIPLWLNCQSTRETL